MSFDKINDAIVEELKKHEHNHRMSGREQEALQKLKANWPENLEEPYGAQWFGPAKVEPTVKDQTDYRLTFRVETFNDALTLAERINPETLFRVSEREYKFPEFVPLSVAELMDVPDVTYKEQSDRYEPKAGACNVHPYIFEIDQWVQTLVCYKVFGPFICRIEIVMKELNSDIEAIELPEVNGVVYKDHSGTFNKYQVQRNIAGGVLARLYYVPE